MQAEPVDTQLYLMAPALDAVSDATLAAVLAEGVACLLVDISGFVEADAGALERMIDVAGAAECPLLVGGDDSLALELARRFALDGVHLSGGPKQIEWARKQLGKDSIVGYGAGVSREDALTAAEGGADYVLLGPLRDLDPDLPEWWQAVIATPLVIDAGSAIDRIAGVADFAMVGEAFAEDDPAGFVRGLKKRLLA